MQRLNCKAATAHGASKGRAQSSVALGLAIALTLGLMPMNASGAEGDAGQLDKAKAEKVFTGRALYSPYAGRNFPTRPYFGDTHLHTSFSMDAGAFGARLGLRDAYVFAKGNEIKSSSGQPVKLSRPLDFLVVADLSDGFGFATGLTEMGLPKAEIPFALLL